MKQPKNAFEWATIYFRNGDKKLRETKSTMSALFSYADFDDLTCYPSQSKLSEVAGSSVETVRRHLKKNVQSGWLVVIEQGSSYKSSTRYKLSTPTNHEGSQCNSPQPRGEFGELPLRTRSTPLNHEGSTPLVDDRLTTHITTHEPLTKSGSNEELIPGPGGPGVGHLSTAATTQVPTPLNHEGSYSPQRRGESDGDPFGETPLPPPALPDWKSDPFAGRFSETG